MLVIDIVMQIHYATEVVTQFQRLAISAFVKWLVSK